MFFISPSFLSKAEHSKIVDKHETEWTIFKLTSFVPTLGPCFAYFFYNRSNLNKSLANKKRR